MCIALVGLAGYGLVPSATALSPAQAVDLQHRGDCGKKRAHDVLGLDIKDLASPGDFVAFAHSCASWVEK